MNSKTSPTSAQSNEPGGELPDEEGRTVLPEIPGIEAAWDFILKEDTWALEVQKELTSIPAPPFQEEARGRRVAELFRNVGLAGTTRDEVGNVLASLPPHRTRYKDPTAGPLLISAHLDTVFPPGTDVTVREDGPYLRAPGISDDGRGLAALVALARTLTEVPLAVPGPVLLVATVGEEGAGDLRGVRHLFRDGGPGREARGFISLDGAGLARIIHRGVGSVRLRITASGPGGHSWTDWGTPNPIHTLAEAISAAGGFHLSSDPKTTMTVARWGGGKSINAIPEEAWIEVDLRSESAASLSHLETAFKELFHRGSVPDPGPDGSIPEKDVLIGIEELGRRPAGATDPDSVLVRSALAATRALGKTPELTSSSTDANVPMALGIPSITLGAGGRAGGIHTTNEWYRNEKGPEGILRALLTLLLALRPGSPTP